MCAAIATAIGPAAYGYRRQNRQGHCQLGTGCGSFAQFSNRAVADIFAIAPFNLPRSRWQRLADFADRRLVGFIEADDGMLGVGGAMIDLQHILYVIDDSM